MPAAPSAPGASLALEAQRRRRRQKRRQRKRERKAARAIERAIEQAATDPQVRHAARRAAQGSLTRRERERLINEKAASISDTMRAQDPTSSDSAIRKAALEDAEFYVRLGQRRSRPESRTSQIEAQGSSAVQGGLGGTTGQNVAETADTAIRTLGEIGALGLPVPALTGARSAAIIAKLARAGKTGKAATAVAERTLARSATKTASRQASKAVSRGAGKRVAARTARQKASTRAVRQKAAQRARLSEAEKLATRSQKIGAKLAARQATKRGPLRRALKKGPKGGKAKAGIVGGAASGTGLGGAALAFNPAVPAAVSQSEGAQRLATTPYYLGKATLEDPVGVAAASGRSLRDALLGLPAAAYKTVTDPVGTAETVIKDYKRRYGPLLEGDEEKFMERVKETGLTPFAFDALVAAPPAGRAAGAAARAGSLGKRAQKFATKARPGLVRAPGKVVEQRVAKNLGSVAAQRVVDAARRKKQLKRERRGAAQGVRTGPDEVVPLRQKKALREEAAVDKGRARQAMLSEQLDEVHRGVSKAANTQLSKAERRGFKYALQLGIPDSPGVARSALRKRLADIAAYRAERSASNPEYRLPAKTLDEVKTIQWLIDNADEVFTPNLARFTREQRSRARRLAENDPGIDQSQAAMRAVIQQAEHLGIERLDGETPAQFGERVLAEAEKVGLEEPGYFPSQLKQTTYGQFAVGGRRAVGGPKQYKGRLFREGIEDPRPEAFAMGMARNIKRKSNWNLVGDTFEKGTLPWSRNKNVFELMREMERRGIDISEVAFWNPRLYRERRAAAETMDGDEMFGGVEDRMQGVGEAVQSLDQQGQQLLASLIQRARNGERIDPATLPEEFKSAGWSLLPKAIYDEVHASANVSTLGRVLDIATMKQSRFLLGALNIPWLQFQVLSNAVLTGIGGASPFDMVAAQRWWGSLTREQQRAVEPYIGLGHFQSDVRQTKLGAASNSQIVNAYRAFKETAGGKYIWGTRGRMQVRDFNPLDLLFRADNAQNNFFRRAVLYNRLKRDAYKRMGENATAIGKAQNELASLLGKGPRKQMEELLRDPVVLERHARHVNDFLGDYVTYTARERAFLKRNVMFYGFLRFSLRFTFYTMPVKHPVMTGLFGNLARLEADETRDLLGGDELPYGLGRIYSQGGKLYIDLARANPVTNSLVTIASAANTDDSFFAATGLLPPLYGAIISQFSKRDPFTGKPWKVEGETTTREEVPIGMENRGRILLAQGLSLFYPYRLADEILSGGAPQGADSLAFDLRPTEYKDEEVKRSIAKTVRETESESVAQRVARDVLPLGALFSDEFKTPSHDKQIARSIRQRRREEERALGLRPSKEEEDLMSQFGIDSPTTDLYERFGLESPASTSDELMERFGIE